MELTQEDQDAIQRGLDAEILLELPAFDELLKSLTMASAVEILETNPEDKEERERLYYKSQGLQAIQTELVQRKAAKEAIMVRLEQSEAMAREYPSQDLE